MKSVNNLEGISIPDNLNTKEVISSINDWFTYKVERKETYKSKIGITRLLTRLSEMGPVRAIKAIDYSMSNNWAGIFEPQQPSNTSNGANDAKLAWGNVERAIRAYGRNAKLTAYKGLPPRVIEVCEEIGWTNLCNLTKKQAQDEFSLKFFERFGR